MAITFVDAVRVSPSPCQHFLVTIRFDGGEERSKVFTLDAIERLLAGLDELFPGSDQRAYDGALALLWAAYQIRNGRTIAQMRGKIVAEPVV